MAIVVCLECGIEFEKVVRKDSSSNHFCGRSCAARYNNRVHPKRRPEGKCRTCGCPVRTSDRYCSDDCKGVASKARKIPEPVLREHRAQAVVGWRRRTKQRALALKGGCCQVCGYSKAVSALVFHHLDPSQKDFVISNSNCKSWARVQKELEKCVLLCNRCHAEVHEGLISLSSEACRI